MVQKTRLDIMVEAHALGVVENILEKAGAKGWTVFAGVQGSGSSGRWQNSGINSAAEMRLVVVITQQQAAQTMLSEISAFLAEYPGIVTATEVSVLRNEKF